MQKFEARTETQAVAKAAKEFGVMPRDVAYTVKQEPTHGFFGMGGKACVIEAAKKDELLALPDGVLGTSGGLGEVLPPEEETVLAPTDPSLPRMPDSDPSPSEIVRLKTDPPPAYTREELEARLAFAEDTARSIRNDIRRLEAADPNRPRFEHFPYGKMRGTICVLPYTEGFSVIGMSLLSEQDWSTVWKDNFATRLPRFSAPEGRRLSLVRARLRQKGQFSSGLTWVINTDVLERWIAYARGEKLSATARHGLSRQLAEAIGKGMWAECARIDGLLRQRPGRRGDLRRLIRKLNSAVDTSAAEPRADRLGLLVHSTPDLRRVR